jgi:hypothetical protein
VALADPHLGRLQREIESAVRGFSPEQLTKSMSGKWSAAEILEHLYLTYTGTIRGFARVLEAGKPLATKSTIRKRVATMVVFGLGRLPSGRESPPMARPKGLPAEKVIAEIGGKIAELDDIMAQCAEKFGKTVPLLDHPLLGPFSAPQWGKFHLVHGMHHMKQIRRLREQLGLK